MYPEARLVDDAGEEKELLTFGPAYVEPELQRRGYGKQLMEYYSFTQAVELGYGVIRQAPAHHDHVIDMTLRHSAHPLIQHFLNKLADSRLGAGIHNI